MLQEIIPLSELPVLTPNIKRAICMFAWSLYQIEDKEEKSAHYLLRTSSGRFLLKTDGNVIKEVTREETVIIKSQVFFDGFSLSSENFTVEL